MVQILYAATRRLNSYTNARAVGLAKEGAAFFGQPDFPIAQQPAPPANL